MFTICHDMSLIDMIWFVRSHLVFLCSLYVVMDRPLCFTPVIYLLFIMAAPAGHYIFALYFFFFLSLCFSSPNLNRRRLDVYRTSTHGVALVLI